MHLYMYIPSYTYVCTYIYIYILVNKTSTIFIYNCGTGREYLDEHKNFFKLFLKLKR